MAKRERQVVQYEEIEKLFDKRFGRLTVLPCCFVEDIQDSNGKIIPNKRKYILKCKCDCGNYYYTSRMNLLLDKVHSCGCLHSEITAEKNRLSSTKYSDADSQSYSKYNGLYHSWSAMKNRCTSESNVKYKYYGGRGITICDEWSDYENFKSWALSNGWKEGLTLDRIDSDKNYEPSNCRWVTMKTQQNNKRNNKMLTYKGKTQTLSEWVDELGLNYDRVKARLNDCNMTVEEAFERRLFESHDSYMIRKACEEAEE